MTAILFKNRTEAGRQLAQQLMVYSNQRQVIVLALPRGGVPVAYPIAQALQVSLDVFVVRKLGVPGQEELAIGAIASGGMKIFNQDIIRALHITSQTIDEIIAHEQSVLQARERLFRRDKEPLDVLNRIVILVDDGIATGATIGVAIQAISELGCQKLIVAVPVASPEILDHLKPQVDDVICLTMPEHLCAIGSWYADFTQTTDEEAQSLLQRAQAST